LVCLGQTNGTRAREADLREVYGEPTHEAAEAAIDVFADRYGAKYDKAVACLTKDRDALLAFFDIPAEYWDHLRTSNPIESQGTDAVFNTQRKTHCGKTTTPPSNE
jgi:transposase-like protein